MRERGRLAEKRMDALFALGYDERWRRVNLTHETMLGRFLSLLPAGGAPLFAPGQPLMRS